MKKLMIGVAAAVALALVPGCGKKTPQAAPTPTPGAMQHMGAVPERPVKETPAGAQAAPKTPAAAAAAAAAKAPGTR